MWQLYLLLKTISEYTCVTAISPQQIAYLRILSQEYLEMRSSLFPECSLKPKHHFLSHYPDLIFEFGPLIRLWTLRYESKHGYFKKCARAFNNYINITKSLTMKNQLKFMYLTCSNNLYGKEIIVRQQIFTFTDLEVRFFPPNTSKFQIITINGTSYSKNMCLVLNGTMRELKVGIIFSLGICSDSVLFLIETTTAVLDDMLGVHVLQFDTEKTYKLINFNNIEKFTYEPLNVYHVFGKKSIVLKYSYPFL